MTPGMTERERLAFNEIRVEWIAAGLGHHRHVVRNPTGIPMREVVTMVRRRLPGIRKVMATITRQIQAFGASSTSRRESAVAAPSARPTAAATWRAH